VFYVIFDEINAKISKIYQIFGQKWKKSGATGFKILNIFACGDALSVLGKY